MAREGQMLKVEEVAARLRANPETVRRWLRAGTLKGVRPGGTRLGWRIPEGEVRRVLRENGEG
jgi:excisionase family DNA binding protein